MPFDASFDSEASAPALNAELDLDSEAATPPDSSLDTSLSTSHGGDTVDGISPLEYVQSVEGASVSDTSRKSYTPRKSSKAKNAASALKVSRRFTRADQDPFETTEWERRTASISGEDGKSVFEQRDVEIPKAWSQLATNVVVSKYFRGAMSSPTRENSVRQIIGRVSDTIGNWGKTGGYFATDEDARAFRDELVYLLLHQYGSFNSPVWFNLGVPGAKQQGSACQPYDARVSTPQGLIPIGELVERDAVGEMVYCAGGVARILATKHNGTKRVLRLHTKAGYTLDATPDHLVWKSTGFGANGHTGRWVEAGELRAGDLVEWHRAPSVDKAQEPSGEEAEAALAGWLQSDGFVGQYQTGTNTSLTIEAIVVNADEEVWVRAAIARVLPGVHAHTREVETQNPNLQCQRIRLYGEALRPFVEKWDLLKRGTQMQVPEALFSAPLSVSAAYLRSLFQAEGYVSVRENARIGLDMISEQLVRGAQQLLGRFGIYARVRFKADARADRHGCWSLSIRTLGDRELFAQEIGFVSQEKSDKLQRSLELHGLRCGSAKRLQIERIESRGKMPVYDIQTSSGEYLSGGLRVHNCFINSVQDDMESIMELAATEARLFKGGSGAGTNLFRIRSSKEHLSAGGIASGPVSFMRGWDAFAGAIKSGGTTRRAAKMVILNADHPDISEFIRCKADEEKKAWALIDAGYNGGFNVPGGAYDSVDFQNANHSIRATDEFMRAAEEDREWATRAVTSGQVMERKRAKQMLHEISEATHICGDPGMQFDTTINDWHTCANTDRINASNPCCVTGDTLVGVADGRTAVPIRELVGCEVPVFAHDHASGRTTVSRMWNISVKRENVPIYRVTLDDGSTFRATDDHLIMTRDGSYRMVRDLAPGDSLMPFHSKVLAPAGNRTKRRFYWSGRAWAPQYRAVWEWFHGAQPTDTHIHHRDCNALNDAPENLELLPADEHNALHAERMIGDNNPARRMMNDAWRRHISEAVSGERNPNFGRTHSDETRETMRAKSAQRWNDPAQREIASQAAQTWIAEAKKEGRAIGRPRRPRHDKCCPVCRANFATPREAQLFCSLDCHYSPMGKRMSGEKTGAANRGRALSVVHREKLSQAVSAASDSTQKRAAQEVAQRNAVLKTARLLLDAGASVSLGSWESQRETARALGARRVPNANTTAKFFSDDAQLREEAALYNHKVATVEFCGHEDVYDGTVDTHHNFAILTSREPSCVEAQENFSGIFIHNSEFVFLDDTACNLASLNLMKFRDEGGNFDAKTFVHACEIFITAQEIIVSNASYPTPKIAENSENYRPLGLGYCNLGALLMAGGLAYDSDAGRALAGAITAIMTGAAYRQSARVAANVGAFNGYAQNRAPMLRVIRKHRDAVSGVNRGLVPPHIVDEAQACWDEALILGEKHGYRNAQATVLAPTGCLVGGSLVQTDRGLLRMNRLGDVNGQAWQDVDFQVQTDEGPRQATKFFINGVASTRTIRTQAGYTIQGTGKHRVKVVNASGGWEWKRFDALQEGDIVPLAMNTLLGTAQRVELPPLGDFHWTGDTQTRTPREMSPELAELLGYFMGDGSLHAKGLRLCVANGDADVVERLRALAQKLFNLPVHTAQQQGYVEVAIHSVPLAGWWQACGFAKLTPREAHSGKGFVPQIPDAVLHSNDADVYGAFLRGLFEADGTLTAGVPSLCSAHAAFADEVRTLLLALGFPTSTKIGESGWGARDTFVLRLRNASYNPRFRAQIGFMSARKSDGLVELKGEAKRDRIYLPQDVLNELTTGQTRRAMQTSVRRHGAVSRQMVEELFARSGDERLAHALGFFYDAVAANEDGGEQPTYDLSVPGNVTYIAQGFVSHNTIAFMMDADTTGIEPDIALVKYKKLVGGGLLKIVNQTVPAALCELGYDDDQAQQIVDFIDKNDTIEGAPGLKDEHLSVFDCAFKAQNGTRSIHHMGHIKMMAAAQPFISGAISKTANMPQDCTVEDITDAYLQSWHLGLKAVAIYRDGSKRTQPLSTSSDAQKSAAADKAQAAVAKPFRRKLPDERNSITHKFSIAGQEGYFMVGLYDDGSPGEIFIKMSKEGSTISGLMDSFAVSVSLALQYGVPLRVMVNKFTHTRFEPAGYTTNREIPIAKSLMDYIFRWFDLKFHPNGTNGSLNKSPEQVAMALSAPNVKPSNGAQSNGHAVAVAASNGGVHPAPPNAEGPVLGDGDLNAQLAHLQQDAPPCSECGTIMTRAGACYKCSNCGTTSGCG